MSENLGATAVAPVAPVDTSLNFPVSEGHSIFNLNLSRISTGKCTFDKKAAWSDFEVDRQICRKLVISVRFRIKNNHAIHFWPSFSNISASICFLVDRRYDS